MKLEHGGNLIRASAEFGIPVADWIDLSTGISPWSWPVPQLPADVLQRLPEEEDGLTAVAAAYYRCGADRVLPIPGSQYAISRLPGLWARGTVALPLWGYHEHHRAWRGAGHQLVLYRDTSHLVELIEQDATQYAVVINPGNPTTEIVAADLLQTVAAVLAERKGWLVLDEAFADPYPFSSQVSHCLPNTVVLRSLGKFFGLAGVRLGFVLAAPPIIRDLEELMDPWEVSHPARWIGRHALADTEWQKLQTHRLEDSSACWQRALQKLFPHLIWKRTAHFLSTRMKWSKAESFYLAAARQGLLLRLIGPAGSQGMIRIGLPLQQHWQHAVTILSRIRIPG